MNNKLLFAKTKENAIIPTKNTEDAGYDIYPCFEENIIVIKPNEIKMIPTGIASAISKDYYIQLQERGSTGTKGISQRCGVIDSGYRKEWFVPINNTSNKPIYIIKEKMIDKYINHMEYQSDALITYLNYHASKPGDYLNYGNQWIDALESEDCHITFYPYEKAICQAVVLPVPKMEVKEVSYEELLELKSERGMGCLGSSGK